MKPAHVLGAALQGRIMRALKSAPHARADELAAHLGAAVPDVSAALRALRASGVVLKTGNTRGATYRIA